MNSLKIELFEIENAYKKLKHYVYYDNSNLFLRKQIAEFEAMENFQDKFEQLKNNLEIVINKENEEIKELNSYLLKLLEDMSYWTLPKSYKDNETSNDSLLTNVVDNSYIKIKREIQFIDAPIEIHIITVLWIIREGYVLQKGQNDLYGYKLELDSTGKIVNGLRLFKPYYEEYQKWRDNSIQTARNIINEKKNTLLIGLDIKDYYHSIELDEENLLQTIGTETSLSPFTVILFKIHEFYTKKILKNLSCKPFLPIGFLSSGILANYYLNEFDCDLKKKINPLFYGRYVDDILITLCVDSNNKYKNTEEVLQKFFIDEKLLNEYNDGTLDKEEGEQVYQLSNQKYNKLEIQNKKISVMFFDHKSSLSILDRFVKEIRKSSSEYRFLPDEDLANESFEESTIKITYDGSVNKLRSVKEFQEDRFAISSFLAKKIFISLQMKSKTDKETSHQILQFFNGKKSLEYYTLWEKIFTYFIITKNCAGFQKFIKNVIWAINRVKKQKPNIATDFLNYLLIAIASSSTLRPQYFENYIYEKSTEKIKEILPSIDIIINLRKADLTRKSYMKYSIINFTKDANISPYLDFIEPQEINKLNNEVVYPSRFIHLHEISILDYLFRINNNKLEDNMNEKSVLTNTKELFNEYNNSSMNNSIDANDINPLSKNENIYSIIVNKDIYKNNLKVALANITIDENIFSKTYMRNPTPSIIRKKEIQEIINQSVKEKSDLLVLPECSIPKNWLSWIINNANKTQLAMVFGMEHIISNDKAYNIIVTLLPIKMGKYNSLVVDFRLKNNYSPEEIRVLKGYRYEVPKYKKKSYHQYLWNNISFTTFNCYELTDIHARANFKSNVDFIVASEFNKDTSYFSNIIESSARDLHCYFIQSNDAKYGDNRVHQPSRSDIKDLVKIKGGNNATILTTELNITKLREFQVLEYELQKDDNSFKPTPPDFNKDEVEKRIQKSSDAENL